MKSVLISIQPKWCDLIAIGQKTIEVRKNKPKLATPFKVYIYETNWKNNTYWAYKHKGKLGKVIGEFVCDRIDYIRNYGDVVDSCDCIASCLSANEIIEYAKDKNGHFIYTYGWHISDLVIYDEPKELKEFYSLSYQKKCGYCVPICDSYPHCSLKRDRKSITRPPQSWCYVEEQQQ